MERIINFDALFISALKCKSGVIWKPSAKQYNLNAVEETYKMYTKLKNGTWKNGTPRPIIILFPKKRTGLSISFTDRVYQRSINDNVLYPAMTKSFILDNCACQKGKGTDFARKRLKQHLWKFYCNHSTDGYVLQIDIKGYYPNMQHKVVNAKLAKHLTLDIYEAVTAILDTQYKGPVGYNPGSQMVQIAGISLLDELDHYCKERLHARHYLRYMDDILVIHHDKEELAHMLDEIRKRLSEIGFEINEKKTHIQPLSKSFLFLGFEYRITETGKIIMTLNSDNIKRERKKLRRMVKRAKQGLMTREKVDECYKSWKAHASKGNSYKLIQRMDSFYYDLWKEAE